jgi:hypothetical protein
MRAALSRLTAAGDLRFCLLAFLAGRILYSVVGIVGWYLPQPAPEFATHWVAQHPEHAWQNAFAGYERFDAGWYLQIARDGYQVGDPSSAFFPLFPLLVRGLGLLLGGHWLLAAVLVSNAALAVALVLLYRLTTDVLSERTARATVLLTVFNPMGFFLYAPYTESLFLMLTLMCLTMLRRGHWPAAAGAAALATATRSAGIVLGLTMATQALIESGRPRRWLVAWRSLTLRLLASAASTLGLVAYLGFWAWRDTWDVPLRAQREAFLREPAWPWVSVVDGVRGMNGTLTEPGWLIMNVVVVLTVATLALGLVVLRRHPTVYRVYFAATVVLPLTLVRPYAPLTSVPRYYLMAFPAIWALAGLTRRPIIRAATLSISLTLSVLLALMFVSWHDVL